jgi:hypothetical protein
MSGAETTAPRTVDGALERFALTRLRRFVELAAAAHDTDAPQWRALARHAVFSAYRDCATLGLASEARAILAADAARTAGSS